MAIATDEEETRSFACLCSKAHVLCSRYAVELLVIAVSVATGRSLYIADRAARQENDMLARHVYGIISQAATSLFSCQSGTTRLTRGKPIVKSTIKPRQRGIWQ